MDELLKRYFSLERQPFHQEDRGSVILWRFDRAVAGVRVYFSTRSGGVSERSYRSLNLGFHVGDEQERVNRNRELLGGQFGFSPERITSPRQRHTAVVRVLREDSEIGIGHDGGQTAPETFDPCDGLVTALRRAPLLLMFADCVPVVITALTGGERPLVAVLHAGRKGLMEGVVANGFRMLRDEAGGDGLREVSAAIGPSIGPCCYEVDEATATAFTERFGRWAVERRRLDLRAAARGELTEAGVDPAGVHLLDICTSCDTDFYSYRRDGPVTGRHGAIAWIE